MAANAGQRTMQEEGGIVEGESEASREQREQGRMDGGRVVEEGRVAKGGGQRGCRGWREGSRERRKEKEKEKRMERG